jgi:hypothetical protein
MRPLGREVLVDDRSVAMRREEWREERRGRRR